MNKKQKIPSQQSPPKDQAVQASKSTGNPGGRAGKDDSVLHRQGGHRVGDQGTHKRS